MLTSLADFCRNSRVFQLLLPCIRRDGVAQTKSSRLDSAPVKLNRRRTSERIDVLAGAGRPVCACDGGSPAAVLLHGGNGRATRPVSTVRQSVSRRVAAAALTFMPRVVSVGRWCPTQAAAADRDPHTRPGGTSPISPSLPGRHPRRGTRPPVIRTDGFGRVELTGYSRRTDESSLRMRLVVVVVALFPFLTGHRASLDPARCARDDRCHRCTHIVVLIRRDI